MNITAVKLENKRSKLLNRPSSTSNIFKAQADTDYDIKKEEEKKAIIDEIDRVRENSRY